MVNSVREGNMFSYKWIFPAERGNLVSTTGVKNIAEFKMAHEQEASATWTSKKSRKNF